MTKKTIEEQLPYKIGDVVWFCQERENRTGTKCAACGGKGFFPTKDKKKQYCSRCGGHGKYYEKRWTAEPSEVTSMYIEVNGAYAAVDRVNGKYCHFFGARENVCKTEQSALDRCAELNRIAAENAAEDDWEANHD